MGAAVYEWWGGVGVNKKCSLDVVVGNEDGCRSSHVFVSTYSENAVTNYFIAVNIYYFTFLSSYLFYSRTVVGWMIHL